MGYGRRMDFHEGKPAIAVAAVMRPADGRILIVRRSQDDTDPHAGLWEVPGGHIEPGETAAEAAERETREEVGLACQVWSPASNAYRTFRLRDGSGRWGVMFGASLMSDESYPEVKLKLDEHDCFMWVRPDDLLDGRDVYLLRDGTPCGPSSGLPMQPWMVENLAHIAGICLGRDRSHGEGVPKLGSAAPAELLFPRSRLYEALTVGPLIKGWIAAAKARGWR